MNAALRANLEGVPVAECEGKEGTVWTTYNLYIPNVGAVCYGTDMKMVAQLLEQYQYSANDMLIVYI